MIPRLTRLSDVTGLASIPSYDPAAHGLGIVHLGLGAFHRAHQAVMTDDALSRDGGDWRIVSVSLRSRDVAQALAPQNCLYTVIERDAGGMKGRIIASISTVIAADPDKTLKALCNPAVRIVTLTVTEKGYGIDRATGAPDSTNPVVSADIAAPDAPSGVLGLLVAALRRRRRDDIAPFAILCCDNLPSNGQFLRGGVLGFARAVDPDLAGWIEREVAFPSSMVDRITPASTDATLRDAETLTGCRDCAAIETETFLQWVIEDYFPHGRPAWEAGGALFVDDVEPYEQMKLRMLNGAHSMLAYAGFLSGHTFVRDVMTDRALAALVLRHLEAAADSLSPLSGVDFAHYARDLQDRFRNPTMAHRTRQIAMDGTVKMPQRIWSPAAEALEAGRDIGAFAFATAAWMRYCLGIDESGETFALCDPREDEIGAAVGPQPRDAVGISDALHGLPGLVPETLRDHSGWRQAVDDRLATMLEIGVTAAIAHERGRVVWVKN
ncbi:mannitol 2-dehydrogenase [Roseovarius sp. A-2]|uniref:mannitol dehydrogenase family protein n=1 Tax=Roseovarius sp. A-2 TaxID=1570360 RepID=UPI0009B5256D|nr:mannitol dehydrogenase family protein [Roseovarius sp. A-2]GAW37156.1 mannitol 2-dehydrogenase [Roseovarius sp. A-2]